MRSPFLIARFVLFSILLYLNILALGFAAWEVSSLKSAGLNVPGSPVFAIFNACATFFFLVLAGAELVVPHAQTAQVSFECGWTAAMSSLQLASAIDVAINGPPVYCRMEAYEAVCASSTVLAALTWTSSIIILTYFLTLFYLAVSHSSTYPAIWTRTVYKAPWFVEPTLGALHTQHRAPKKEKEPYESPVFRGDDEDDEGDLGMLPLSSPHAPYMRNGDIESASVASTHYRAPPPPARSQESLRPTWAKRVNTRRGIDTPFAAVPVAQRLSRLVKSYWSAPSAPPTPPPKVGLDLPSEERLRGVFLDCHRASYGFFPESVADEDKPISQARLSEWVRARR